MKDLSRRKRIRLPGDIYHQGYAFSITITTYQRYPWFGLYPELASMAMELLPQMVKARHAVCFSWCIMPDHLHLLLQDRDVIGFARVFKGRLTPEARRLEHGRLLWQRSFYDHALREAESLGDVALYIWENPVRAGIIACASAYPWSGSLAWPNWRELLGADTGGDKPQGGDKPHKRSLKGVVFKIIM